MPQPAKVSLRGARLGNRQRAVRRCLQLAWLLPLALSAGAAECFLRDGDVPVVFLGDSITAGTRYTMLLESFLLTRYPTWHLKFRNVGLGGDTAGLKMRGDFAAALKRDVLALHPKVVTINFGMNDARSGDATYWQYVMYLTRLVKELEAAGARVALLSPTPEEGYVPNQPGGSAYNWMVRKYAHGMALVAAKQQVVFVDQLSPFLTVIEHGRKAGVLGNNGAPRLIPDGIHPDWAGGLVMATVILKTFGAPALVSRVEIDAPTRRVLKTTGCSVEFLDASGTNAASVLTFRRSDVALPWPLPPEVELATKLPGFDPLGDLNRYELLVRGLPAACYTVAIDDRPVGVFSRESLAAGVNLARQNGPLAEQGQKLLAMVTEKNEMFARQWRGYLCAADADTGRYQDQIADLSRQIAAREQAIDHLRQPVPHRFTIAPLRSRAESARD